MRNRHYYFDIDEKNYDYIINNCYLSKRRKERQILDLCVLGKRNKEISDETGYAITTIINRKKDLYKKLKEYINFEDEKEKIKIYDREEFKVITGDTFLYNVYMLTFPNNKVYIGITSQEENNRWKDGKGYINNEIMYNDILKYGWKNIKKNILYKDLLCEEAREKEKELIIHYKSHLKKYGYNRSF